MDRLHISIDQTDVGLDEPIGLITFLVNGRSLIDIVRDIELTFPEVKKYPRLAGRYVGIDPESFCYFYENGFTGDDGGKILLLRCDGYDDFGCWPIVARVTEENDRVTWSDFEQQHRGPRSKAGHWVYNLTFIFDRKQYEAELAKCRQQEIIAMRTMSI